MRFAPRPAMFGRDGARRRATPGQYVLAVAACIAVGWVFSRGAGPAADLAHGLARVVFSLAIGMRLCALALSRPLGEPPAAPADLPRYTLILPLYREAEVVAGLAAALERIDYPSDRLQILFALEAEDHATRDAARRHAPKGSTVVIAPAWGPKTKPRACNAALAKATGDIVVIYDAEDRPHPGQLREAAARFAAGGPDLVCLQAPLRIRRERDFLRRQFALEYAAQFEVMLPALARLGLAFPLGGTSNHFRRSALQAVGGWDPYNVTEDADIGLKLGACGGKIAMLSLATYEPAPPSLQVWTPQRTRWIKGHLHTWLVHMRRPLHGGARSFATLQMTLGLNVATALLHGPLALGVVACVLLGLASKAAPAIAPFDAALLATGWLSAAAAMAVGARRADAPMRLADLLAAPLYWPLQSLAGVFAVAELIRRPHQWNKTPHEVQDDEVDVADWPGPVVRRQP